MNTVRRDDCYWQLKSLELQMGASFKHLYIYLYILDTSTYMFLYKQYHTANMKRMRIKRIYCIFFNNQQ